MAKSIFLLGSLLLLVSSSSAISYNPAAHFIYVGCSTDKYSPNTSYAQNLDQVLTSVNNSALYGPYNFTIRSINPQEAITALYQCRSDISMPYCTDCVQEAVSELQQLCFQNVQGVIQMEGCSVRYDNSTILGKQDTGLELRKCGPRPSCINQDDLRSQRDMVLDGLMKPGQSYRVSNSKSDNIKSMAQCIGDLNPDQCQYCISEAIQITKRECFTEFTYGDMFLGKCYVRYTINQTHASRGGISRTGKTIIVIIAGLLTGLVLLITLEAFHIWVSVKGNGKEASKQPK